LPRCLFSDFGFYDTFAGYTVFSETIAYGKKLASN